MLLAGCPSLVRKGSKTAGREKIRGADEGCVVASIQCWKPSICKNFFNLKPHRKGLELMPIFKHG